MGQYTSILEFVGIFTNMTWGFSQEAARIEHQRKLDALREWDDEEVRMLDKAVAKFPQVMR